MRESLQTLDNYERVLCPTPNSTFEPEISIYFFWATSSIYKFSLSVCLYPINIKTAEPIGPKFCVGPLVTPGKVYKCAKKYYEIRKLFWYLFYTVQREDAHR